MFTYFKIKVIFQRNSLLRDLNNLLMHSSNRITVNFPDFIPAEIPVVCFRMRRHIFNVFTLPGKLFLLFHTKKKNSNI